jgi:DHA3 family macrolide efflux protein-like MFS transporter
LFIPIPQPERAPTEAVGGLVRTVWADFRAGLRYVRGWPGLMAIMIMAMIINFVINPAFSLMPLLVTDHFGGEALELAWLESAWGVGMVLGGLLLSVWGGFRRQVYTSLSGLVISGLGVMLVGLTPADRFPLALAALFVAGFMNPLVNGPLFAILQATVAPEMQGRVFTLVGSLASAMMPLSLAVAGPLADAVGVRPWFVVGGAIFSLIGLGSFFVPVIVHIEDDRPGEAAVEVAPSGE